MKTIIVSGFLGSGKTTFINHILGFNKNTLVLENEFGDVSIDSMLIKNDDIIEINSGCICCGLKSNFKEIIHKIDKDQFEYIIIEPTGIAKLTDILEVLKDEENLQIQKCVTIVDCDNYICFHEDFGEFFNDQIKNADIIYITNIENLEEEKIEEVKKSIEQFNKNAIIHTEDFRNMNPDDIVAEFENKKEHKCCCHGHGHKCCGKHHHEHHDHSHEDSKFKTNVQKNLKFASKEDLEKFLDSKSIVRAKGNVEIADKIVFVSKTLSGLEVSDSISDSEDFVIIEVNNE
ncbi:MAG: GTP-binding protein [Finegoldia magna]|uniref:GTP-binding protein n=1 Tax=Finegoldia magna TaxID=1260 RepID=UPI001F5BE1E8|nr:GTP-binding protein [Finegoldia magna]MDU5808181.1 GTP-binding protein [Finegoldia magna]